MVSFNSVIFSDVLQLFQAVFQAVQQGLHIFGGVVPAKATRSAVRTARSGAPIAIRVWLGSPLSQAEPPEI